MFAILMDFVLYRFSRLVSWWQKMNTYESMRAGRKGVLRERGLTNPRREETLPKG